MSRDMFMLNESKIKDSKSSSHCQSGSLNPFSGLRPSKNLSLLSLLCFLNERTSQLSIWHSLAFITDNLTLERLCRLQPLGLLWPGQQLRWTGQTCDYRCEERFRCPKF